MAAEQQNGIIGFNAAQDTLEKVNFEMNDFIFMPKQVSEKKGEVDEAKGKALNEISEIISKLLSTINVI